MKCRDKLINEFIKVISSKSESLKAQEQEIRRWASEMTEDKLHRPGFLTDNNLENLTQVLTSNTLTNKEKIEAIQKEFNIIEEKLRFDLVIGISFSTLQAYISAIAVEMISNIAILPVTSIIATTLILRAYCSDACDLSIQKEKTIKLRDDIVRALQDPGFRLRL